jgi:ABC-type transport system involved in cytochrome c biogenesis permease component
MTKIIALFVAMVFSLVTFAHGQDCTLLSNFSPSILTNGDARTAYSIPEATYTQSCEDAR